MDVLTEEELRVETGSATTRWPYVVASAAYGVLVAAAVAHHERWADEAQSWLLARDAGLVELWTRLLHYEGTTGLWQTLLHVLIQIGLPYWGMSAFSALLGLAAACVLLWRAPFPLAIRVALPFTFFLGYQYVVIARSYSLLPLLLFSYAAFRGRPWLSAALLCLMAAVSVHGMALALAIVIGDWRGTCKIRPGLGGTLTEAGETACPTRANDRLPRVARAVSPAWTEFCRCLWRLRAAKPPRQATKDDGLSYKTAMFVASVFVLLVAAAWPARDVTFIAGMNYSFPHFLDVSTKLFAGAFTGEWVSSLLVVALSIPLLWRGGGWLFFAPAGMMTCVIASVVYSQVWHYGILFLAWLFALWISWTPEPNRLPHKLALVSLAIVTLVQCYWTACSIAYDWDHAYSGAPAAAQALREMHLDGKKLYAIGFATTAIQPYFPHNIFANVNGGRPQAYWDWSRRNHVNDDVQRLDESRPDYIIVGYKNQFERSLWTGSIRRSHYRQIGHFEGNSFWQTRVFEPDSYDLFERTP